MSLYYCVVLFVVAQVGCEGGRGMFAWAAEAEPIKANILLFAAAKDVAKRFWTQPFF